MVAVTTVLATRMAVADAIVAAVEAVPSMVAVLQPTVVAFHTEKSLPALPAPAVRTDAAFTRAVRCTAGHPRRLRSGRARLLSLRCRPFQPTSDAIALRREPEAFKGDSLGGLPFFCWACRFDATRAGRYNPRFAFQRGKAVKMEIVKYPHPALAWKSTPVTKINADLRNIVEEMFELMYEARGIGLAGNQVALPWRLFVINPTGDPEEKDAEMVFINPCLLYTSPSPRDATLSRMPSSA